MKSRCLCSPTLHWYAHCSAVMLSECSAAHCSPVLDSIPAVYLLLLRRSPLQGNYCNFLQAHLFPSGSINTRRPHDMLGFTAWLSMDLQVSFFLAVLYLFTNLLPGYGVSDFLLADGAHLRLQAGGECCRKLC